MIEVANLSKRYGDKLAVDDLSFVVQPGIVTGFLGPNGAGKPITGLRRSLSTRTCAVGRITTSRVPSDPSRA
jgi:ABC-2 type transport system ATP-binding protein